LINNASVEALSVDAYGVDAEQLAADDQFADLGSAGADLQQFGVAENAMARRRG
jgi:hypothetical protein